MANPLTEGSMDLTVKTRTPENCEILAQHYQSQPIIQKFQKHC